MLYDVILTLRGGEIKSLSCVESISWTRARVIFCMKGRETQIFINGDIEDCHLFIHKEV